MNTKFEYMYRDAENYKNFHFEVISGTMTFAQIENYLHEHEFFIPSQIGMPDLQNEPLQLYDHIWHEILSITTTNEIPTIEFNTDQIIQKFKDLFLIDWNISQVFQLKGFT